jgi:hypothetical protein
MFPDTLSELFQLKLTGGELLEGELIPVPVVVHPVAITAISSTFVFCIEYVTSFLLGVSRRAKVPPVSTAILRAASSAEQSSITSPSNH